MVAFRVVTKALHLTARPRGRERRRGRECRRRRPEQNSPCWSDRRAVWRSRTGRARRLRQSARLRGAVGCRRSRWRDARRPVARWRGIGCQAGEPRAGAVLTNRQARRRSDGRPQGLVICAAVTHHRRPLRIVAEFKQLSTTGEERCRRGANEFGPAVQPSAKSTSPYRFDDNDKRWTVRFGRRALGPGAGGHDPCRPRCRSKRRRCGRRSDNRPGFVPANSSHGDWR